MSRCPAMPSEKRKGMDSRKKRATRPAANSSSAPCQTIMGMMWMERPVSADMRSVEAASRIQKTPVLSASAREKSADAAGPDGVSDVVGVNCSISSTWSGGLRTRREQSRPENQHEYRGVDEGGAPAYGGDAETERVEEDRAPGGYAGEQDGHGDGFSADEPAVGGGHEGWAEAEVGRHGDEQDVGQEKEDVVVYEGYDDEADGCQYRAENDEGPGAEMVHEPAVERGGEAGLGAGEGEDEGGIRAGEVEVAPDGIEEDCRAVVEDAAGHDAKQGYAESEPTSRSIGFAGGLGRAFGSQFSVVSGQAAGGGEFGEEGVVFGAVNGDLGLACRGSLRGLRRLRFPGSAGRLRR